MAKKIFNDLNPPQNEAICYTDKPSIILAGAGSGKTRVLTFKVRNLVENHAVDPENILMITFTNKAADEMKNRMQFHRFGFIGTFHSLCVRILRIEGKQIGVDNNFVIYDSNDSVDVMKEVIKELELPKRFSPNFLLNKVSSAKNQLLNWKQYREISGSDITNEIAAKAYEKYQKKLEKNKALDFDDLIFKVVDLFSTNERVLNKYQDKYRHILVDEFQDTNFAQYKLTKLLASKYKLLTVVGDFSQSIYSWRGAEIQNLEKLKTDFPGIKTFFLEENYRSTQNILDFAFEIISKNSTHPVLKLFTQNKRGEEVNIKELSNEQYEALFVADETERILRNNVDASIGVLYRINAQSRVIEEAFLQLGIPYILVGGTRFYERKEIKDLLSYIRLIINPLDELSLKRTIKIGKRRFDSFRELYESIKDSYQEINTIELIDKILDTTKYLDLYSEDDPDDLSRIENIKELRTVAENFTEVDKFLDQVALVESEYSNQEKVKKGDGKGVQLMTLHQAKGLEFDNVFIVGLEEGILPHSRALYDLMELEEERRLFYVGITRARYKLYLTHVRRRFFFGSRTENAKSRFIQKETIDF